MRARSTFAGLELTLADGWCDITHDLPVGTPPTLAKPDGEGAFQFSVARYRSGPIPGIQATDLRRLLDAFVRGHRELGEPTSVVEGGNDGGHATVRADFVGNGDFTRVWYVTSGRDVALVTYVGAGGKCLREMEDCQRMVDSIAL